MPQGHITPPQWELWEEETDPGLLLNQYCTTKKEMKGWSKITYKVVLLKPLEDMARYAGLLLAPAEGFGQKKGLLCFFGPFLLFTSNLGNWMSVPNLGTNGHICPSVSILGTAGQI